MMTKAKPMVFKLFLFAVVFLFHFRFAAGQAPLANPDLPDMTVPYGSTVEFKFNKTSGPALRWAEFGIYDATKSSPNPMLIDVGIFNSETTSYVYDPRVSFIGDLAARQLWFKMVNVNEKDTNLYEVRSKGYMSKVKLNVLPAPVTEEPPVTEAPPTPEWEPLGCYEDSRDRALPIYYYGVAYDPSKEDYKGMFEECKKRAEEKGYEYFGIQHKSECWGSPNGQEITYNKHGCLNNCLRTADGYGIGTHWSNFVYRLNKEWSDCKDGVQYKLVSKKDTCYECPSYNIKIEKSDTSREC